MKIDPSDLGGALDAGTPVRIRRAIRRADDLAGVVLAVGNRWLLLQHVDDVMLNGYAAIRLDDITSMTPVDRGFTRRALALNRQKAEPLPTVSLGSVGEVLSTMQEQFPLITIHCEREFPDECYIGRIAQITARTLRLVEINPEAEWDYDGASTWQLRDITRVEADGRYERALAKLGGPPPSAKVR